MNLSDKLKTKQLKAAIIGLGYVGLPLAATIAQTGIPVTGFDINAEHVMNLNNGHSHIYAVPDDELASLIEKDLFRATADVSEIRECDVIMICVPTPLDKHREPDLSYIANTARFLVDILRPEQMVILESTTYPGTTKEVLGRILKRSGLNVGENYYLAFAPEREDPGNKNFALKSIPKVVGADDQKSRDNAEAFYALFLDSVVPVSTADTAEAVKLTENIFRAVNIALVNELKVIYDAMDIDIWEVIAAAKTKPFGYTAFYPGPGLGGHCIPIDPFYLSYRARAFDLPTRFIELAGEINTNMPNYVIEKLSLALDQRKKLSLSASKILLIGASYKKNVNDIRESPAIDIMAKINKRGASFAYYDPHVPILKHLEKDNEIEGQESIELSAEAIKSYDAVLIVTDHDNVDYKLIADNCDLIVDTRNVFEGYEFKEPTHYVKA
jgi:UDP-N-acetyl-D-glucosamine dehydrogenase